MRNHAPQGVAQAQLPFLARRLKSDASFRLLAGAPRDSELLPMIFQLTHTCFVGGPQPKAVPRGHCEKPARDPVEFPATPKDSKRTTRMTLKMILRMTRTSRRLRVRHQHKNMSCASIVRRHFCGREHVGRGIRQCLSHSTPETPRAIYGILYFNKLDS